MYFFLEIVNYYRFCPENSSNIFPDNFVLHFNLLMHSENWAKSIVSGILNAGRIRAQFSDTASIVEIYVENECKLSIIKPDAYSRFLKAFVRPMLESTFLIISKSFSQEVPWFFMGFNMNFWFTLWCTLFRAYCVHGGDGRGDGNPSISNSFSHIKPYLISLPNKSGVQQISVVFVNLESPLHSGYCHTRYSY